MNRRHTSKSLNFTNSGDKVEKISGKTAYAIVLATLMIATFAATSDTKQTHAQGSSFNGYTLFAPMMSTTTYLINNNGEVVHTWASDTRPHLSAYLLENGNLLRTGVGGHIQEIEWNGTVTWDFESSLDQHRQHHDIEALPNGNVLIIAQETKNATEAISAGRDPSLLPPRGDLWPDHIIEVEPTGATGGIIVWEWHVWDHLVQDLDPTKANYGVVADCPELVDINFVANPNNPEADWNHFNSVDYNEEFDQILVSVNAFREIWVIDHSTTTEEAAGHTGGNSGKGGDLLYRWGNPQAYRAGDESDRKFYTQHDAQWIESNHPGEGNILVFNNGRNRPDGSYSSVDEIVPPMDENGSYSLIPGFAYGPEEQTWIYTAPNPTDFYSPNISGVQRLPNGNTLICCGKDGHFFEVTPEKETVWEYINPFPEGGPYNVFKIRRYTPDHPGLGAWLADVDSDGDVDQDDLAILAGAYGTSPPSNPDCDLDRDGNVDPDDLAIFAANYGETI